MRFVRFQQKTQNFAQWGWLSAEGIGELSAAPFAPFQKRDISLSLEAVRLLAPVVPSKIIGVGRNYPAHAAEHQTEVPKQPLLFLKPPSAVIGPGDGIRLPPQSQRVEHEGELAVVIGRKGRRIPASEAEQYILGYTAANDVTARDLQRSDPQWTRGKGFDTFCPLGPWIETELDLDRAQICCLVNGEVRQRGSLREMVFSIAELVAYCSSVMTLEPGDIILTGTPAGVGPLVEGDLVTVTVDQLSLTNPVQLEAGE